MTCAGAPSNRSPRTGRRRARDRGWRPARPPPSPPPRGSGRGGGRRRVEEEAQEADEAEVAGDAQGDAHGALGPAPLGEESPAVLLRRAGGRAEDGGQLLRGQPEGRLA